MTLQTCKCCKRTVTTRTAKRIGRDASLGPDMLYLNCKCGSTFTLTNRTRGHSMIYFLIRADARGGSQ